MQDPRHDATAIAPREYASRLASELAGLLDDRLTAAYLHGSAALGGWVAERSDVDILVVVARQLPDPALTATGELLMRWATACPGRRGLECSVVTAGQAARPAPPWPFILHVAVRRGGVVLDRGDATAGDDDLLMHYEASRAAGITLAGAPPAAVIGAVDRLVILNYLASELDWGLANGPECYAVLNACRAERRRRSGPGPKLRHRQRQRDFHRIGQLCEELGQCVWFGVPSARAHRGEGARRTAVKFHAPAEFVPGDQVKVRAERASEPLSLAFIDAQQPERSDQFAEVIWPGGDDQQRAGRPQDAPQLGAVPRREDVQHQIGDLVGDR
jgi:hypothetical protein